MLNRLLRIILGAGVLLVSGQELKNSIELKIQYHEDNNGLEVLKPLVKIGKLFGEKTLLTTHFTLDGITGASRTPKYPGLSVDGVSSASQKEIRKEFGASITQRVKNTQITIAAKKSDENDYYSLSGDLRWQQDLFNKNSTFVLEYNHFLDEHVPVDPPHPIDTSNGQNTAVNSSSSLGGDKGIQGILVSWTQILSNRTIARFAWSVSFANGYLGRPYYNVIVEDTIPSVQDPNSNGGTLYLETYPTNKISQVGKVLLQQGFPSFYRQGSIQLAYRWAWDTWGISSNTFSCFLKHYIHSNFILKLGYRGYFQSEAVFYRDRYNLRNVNKSSSDFMSYLTVDSRLDDIYSLTLSIKISYLLKNFVKPKKEEFFSLFLSRMDIELERYLRSTHMDKEIRERRYESYGSEGLQAWTVRGSLRFTY